MVKCGSKEKVRVAVGLSGGVDSSVCAALLKREGHEVVGVMMKLWREGMATAAEGACFGPGAAAEMARVEEVARQLSIEFVAVDCLDEFERTVLGDFRCEYMAGRTPNPCVRCNEFLKFGALPLLARKAGLAFDRLATGHYARVEERDGRYHLFKGADPAKDQSYFLHRLSQEQLASVRFPLGGYTKTEVRRLAKELGLATRDRSDSQDFYGGSYADLLGEADRPGKIVDRDGKVLGTHNGFWRYTIGQRKGLGIAAPAPLYVLGLDAARNEVVVGPVDDVVRHRLRIADCNWISDEIPATCEAKIRSVSRPARALVRERTAREAVLEFPEGVSSPAAGQSAVLYRGDEVLGGGIIMEVFE